MAPRRDPGVAPATFCAGIPDSARLAAWVALTAAEQASILQDAAHQARSPEGSQLAEVNYIFNLAELKAAVDGNTELKNLLATVLDTRSEAGASTLLASLGVTHGTPREGMIFIYLFFSAF